MAMSPTERSPQFMMYMADYLKHTRKDITMNDWTIFRSKQQTVNYYGDMFLEDHLQHLRTIKSGWTEVVTCAALIPQIWDIVLHTEDHSSALFYLIAFYILFTAH